MIEILFIDFGGQVELFTKRLKNYYKVLLHISISVICFKLYKIAYILPLYFKPSKLRIRLQSLLLKINGFKQIN